jgi:hypothetical protein
MRPSLQSREIAGAQATERLVVALPCAFHQREG